MDEGAPIVLVFVFQGGGWQVFGGGCFPLRGNSPKLVQIWAVSKSLPSMSLFLEQQSRPPVSCWREAG